MKESSSRPEPICFEIELTRQHLANAIRGLPQVNRMVRVGELVYFESRPCVPQGGYSMDWETRGVARRCGAHRRRSTIEWLQRTMVSHPSTTSRLPAPEVTVAQLAGQSTISVGALGSS